MKQRIGMALVLALLLSLALAGVASAHAELVSSDPASGAELATAPAKVTLVFSEEISDKATESFFTVTDEQGAEVGKGALDNTDLDHKTLSGALKAGLGDGVYTVKWQTITPDDQGKSAGSFSFSVNKDPGAQPTAALESESHPTAAATAAPAQPTAASRATPAATSSTAGAAPATLPKTGQSDSKLSLYLLLAALVLLSGAVLLYRRRHRA